jgi:hypothetical protein
MARVDVGVLWCAKAAQNRANGWSYPRAVERRLREITTGKRVLQQFGGLSSWGVRLDLDPVTRPHIIGDAWMPPFRKDAFDVAILDPPYVSMNQQMKTQLLRQASYIAREYVIWFHTLWIAADARLTLERAWLVRVGNSSHCRCLQVFRCPVNKQRPVPMFTRGPAIKYNRWLSGQRGLNFQQEDTHGHP